MSEQEQDELKRKWAETAKLLGLDVDDVDVEEEQPPAPASEAEAVVEAPSTPPVEVAEPRTGVDEKIEPAAEGEGQQTTEAPAADGTSEEPESPAEPTKRGRKRSRSRSRSRRKGKAAKVEADLQSDVADSSGSTNERGKDAEALPKYEPGQQASDDDDSDDDDPPSRNWDVPSWEELIASLYRPNR